MKFLRLPLVGAIAYLCACHHGSTRIAKSATPVSWDNSYVDLAGGGRLRIVVPMLKPGATSAIDGPRHETGNTIELSASNLIGYEVSYYFVEGHGNDQVRLRFIGAQTTKDRTTVPDTDPPKLPFALPLKTEHVRLIYYVRKSELDHNMAMAASKDLAALNAFTERFERDPAVCGADRVVSCAWVPAGVAVRPE